MAYFVYLVECSDHSLYCGFTTDLDKRLAIHRAGKGSKYTRARLPVKMVYSESFPQRTQALKREYEIKQLSRAQKIQLVDSKKKK